MSQFHESTRPDSNCLQRPRMAEPMHTITKPSRRRGAAGFTLIELLVVLSILSLLAFIAVPQVLKYLSGAKTGEATLTFAPISATAAYGRKQTLRLSLNGCF